VLSLTQCRKIDPSLNDVPDEELAAALEDAYAFARLALGLSGHEGLQLGSPQNPSKLKSL
jgi:hypothetical protein